jgi:uncharacterized protein YfaQ (DUF2300 family)
MTDVLFDFIMLCLWLLAANPLLASAERLGPYLVPVGRDVGCVVVQFVSRRR